jgi:hypothetical protein
MGRFFCWTNSQAEKAQKVSLTFNPSDRTCFPADEAPTVTDEVAICQVCDTQWQVRSGDRADAQGCSFCDAPASAITVVSEAPGYEGELV